MASGERKPFKESLDAKAVRALATALTSASSEFDGWAFVRAASRGLSKLELKDRVEHIIAALHRHLPEDYPAALEVVRGAGRAWRTLPDRPEGFAFAVWPLIDYVGEHGLAHFDASMAALRELTPLFSAEFAVRPFIRQDERRALAILSEWTEDPDEHVRRLVSEGTRPRLPWGGHLARFIQDPSPVLELLERLRDDPSEYVRRSVANNLNDIAKDHPAAVVEACGRWSGHSPERDWIVRRALRTLVKQGDPSALKVLGYAPNPRVEVSALALRPQRARLGDDVELRFTIRSTSRRAQPLIVDYVVHHVKKNGTRTPKVFKLKTVELGAGASLEVRKRHKLRKITTRVYHSGRHVVDVLVNGKVLASAEFHLSTGD